MHLMHRFYITSTSRRNKKGYAMKFYEAYRANGANGANGANCLLQCVLYFVYTVFIRFYPVYINRYNIS